MGICLTSNAPPKIQYKTGRLAPATTPAGRMTLTVRQSSLWFVAAWIIGRVVRSPRICRNRLWFSPDETSICGQAAAGLMASYASPRFVDNFWGGLSRRDPVGGSANGMPANFSTLPLASPTTVLDGEMATVGEAARPLTTGEPWRAGRARTQATREAQAEVERTFIVAPGWATEMVARSYQLRMLESDRRARQVHQGETGSASSGSHHENKCGVDAHFIYEIAHRIGITPNPSRLSTYTDDDHSRVKMYTVSAWEFNRFPIRGAQKKAS